MSRSNDRGNITDGGSAHLTGLDEDFDVMCTRCRGTGAIGQAAQIIAPSHEDSECPVCKGTGYKEMDYKDYKTPEDMVMAFYNGDMSREALIKEMDLCDVSYKVDDLTGLIFLTYNGGDE